MKGLLTALGPAREAFAGLVMLGLALWFAAGQLELPTELEGLVVERSAVHVVDPTGGPRPWDPIHLPDDDRIVHRLDGQTIEDPAGVDLAELDPGLHILETLLTRRGNRRERVVDHVLVGPFQSRWSDAPGCGLSLAISEDAVEATVIPQLREHLLAAVRRNDYLGPKTVMSRAELDLYAGAARFSVALTGGPNEIVVEGWLRILVSGPRNVDTRLVRLTRVEFTGQTRDRYDTAGAAVGAVVTGPLAPVGAYVGYRLTDSFVTKKAREIVDAQVRAGLARAKRIDLFPAEVELLPGRPRSRVELAFCDDLRLLDGGMDARVSVRPVGSAAGATPGPVVAAVELPAPGLDPDQDLRLDLSVDLVNALVDAWTANGLMGSLLDESGMRRAANEELGNWTHVEVAGVALELPPVLGRGGPDAPADGWTVRLAGLRLRLVDRRDGRPFAADRTLRLQGRGVVRTIWDEDEGTLTLAGGVQDLAVVCAEPLGARERLRPCFNALLELGEVADRVDASLAPGARTMPTLHLRRLIDSGTQGRLRVGALQVAHPRPGVLRFAAVADAP